MKTGTLFGYLIAAAIGFGVGFAVKDSRDGTLKAEAKKPPKAAEPSEAQAAAKPKAKAAGAKDADVFKVPVGDSVQKGPDDALVTIVAFSDFQCPFCSRVLPTLTKVEEKYGDDVRMVFKHNPLPFHRQAPLAHEYALAAAEQGKFWEMHDKLFQNQKALQPDDLKKYAEEVGLDLQKVEAYLESGKGKKVIAEDQKLARQIGATGTPSFYVNGVKIAGAQPYPKFEQIIDARMAVAKKALEKGVRRSGLYAALIEEGRTSPPPRPKRKPRKQPPAVRQEVALSDATPTKGADAPLVTIVEFSDFQCPFCARINPTIDEILKTYGDDVQVRFRNLPLGFHQRAEPAARAALAAHAQGKFWEMHDKLFANQRALQDDDLKKYAEELGLDVAKFEEDMASEAIKKQVKADMAAARKYGARGTPTSFVNGVPVRGAQPFARFKGRIDAEIELAEKLIEEGVKRSEVYAEILKREAGKAPDGGKAKPAAAKPQPKKEEKPVDIELGKAPLHGDEDAPVQVVVFSDFECPFCGRVNPSIDKLKEEYGDKVAVAFKHYPLPFHQNARRAAIASLAAHRQGKFWEMHDKLFANQRALSEDDIRGYAEELGLDMDEFEADLNDPELEAWVDADMKEGRGFGVTGTPATFINGRKIVGAQPYSAFKKKVDEVLSES